jgi:nucleoside 2-deoxyribosyltransferase
MPKQNFIYLSAPLFTQVQRKWNRLLAREIEGRTENISVILPQDFRIEGKYNDSRTYPKLFRRCIESIKRCSLLIASLDGADTDSGVAFEVGVAFSQNIPVVGIRTDFREGQDKGLNLMLSQSCATIVREYSFNEDLPLLADSIVRRLDKVFK